MRPLSIASVLLLAACAGPPEPTLADDPAPDAIYTDFLGGKFDAAGHPVGAFVLEGDGCAPATGWVWGDRVHVDPTFDDAGVACTGATDPLGLGIFAVNVRASLSETCDEACAADPIFGVTVYDDAGAELASRDFVGADFSEPYTYENLPVELTVRAAGAVRVEVRWAGVRAAQLEYVEVFRRDRQLVLEPMSGVPGEGAALRIEAVDPPADATLTARCGDLDRTEALDALLASGDATDEVTEFRRIVTAPLAAILEGCALPTRLVVELRRPDRGYATSELYFLGEPIPCPADDGRPLVVLTGFLPFPAGSANDNSSREAALGFDPATVPEARVLAVELPVEFDTAAALVADLSARCDPAVVVGFGQGRWRVDLETTAYNAKDTSEVPGGVPDNRGLVLDGDPIREGGPAELPSRLPIDAIRGQLEGAGVDVATSDDPGRYICNNLFYSLAHDAPPERVVGFVHLPILRRVDAADRAMLQTVVETVVRESLASRP